MAALRPPIMLLCLVFFSACTMHCPECHIETLQPRNDQQQNLVVITQYHCKPEQWKCVVWQGPSVWVEGNELQFESTCSNGPCRSGHGSIAELSVAGGKISLDVLGGKAPPRWIVDHPIEVPADGATVYVWISDFGRQVNVVSEALACRGEDASYARAFPIPARCSS